MTLAELIVEVYTITGRADRVAETLSAVRSATLKAHQSDFYAKDLVENIIAFNTAEFVQNLDYRALLSRWRALKYIRKYNITSGTPGKFLSTVVPENVMDKYAIQQQDICYIAGQFLQINSSTQEQYYILGNYLNPDITEVGYSSWVALDHPYAIVYDAAATVFKAIGKDEESSAMRSLVQEQYADIKISSLSTTGF